MRNDRIIPATTAGLLAMYIAWTIWQIDTVKVLEYLG